MSQTIDEITHVGVAKTNPLYNIVLCNQDLDPLLAKQIVPAMLSFFSEAPDVPSEKSALVSVISLDEIGHPNQINYDGATNRLNLVRDWLTNKRRPSNTLTVYLDPVIIYDAQRRIVPSANHPKRPYVLISGPFFSEISDNNPRQKIFQIAIHRAMARAIGLIGCDKDGPTCYYQQRQETRNDLEHIATNAVLPCKSCNEQLRERINGYFSHYFSK